MRGWVWVVLTPVVMVGALCVAGYAVGYVEGCLEFRRARVVIPTGKG